jgi:hypothetical protein
VTVLVEATTSWGEGIVRGVVNFARVNHRPLAAQLMGLGVPTVNVSWFDWEPAMTTVTSDEIGIGRLAAEHATRGVEVADVLSEVPVSRRWLEQRCRELLGRSPAEELRRIRIDGPSRRSPPVSCRSRASPDDPVSATSTPSPAGFGSRSAGRPRRFGGSSAAAGSADADPDGQAPPARIPASAAAASWSSSDSLTHSGGMITTTSPRGRKSAPWRRAAAQARRPRCSCQG